MAAEKVLSSYMISKSVSPLDTSNEIVGKTEKLVKDLSIQRKNKIIGVKPTICENKPMLKSYENDIKTVLVPLTNQLYKYNIRNNYINFINNNFESITKKREKDAIIIEKPSLEETIDFSFLEDKNYHIIGLLSSWIDLGTQDALINKISFEIIINELMIAHYNQINNVIISPPKNVNNISNYCEILLKVLSYINDNKLKIVISISLPIITNEDIDHLSTWELWLKIKTLCNHNANLNISLALSQTYSSANLDFLNKWVFEPVGSLLLSSSIFLPNKFEQPVLNKLNQLIIKKFQLIKEPNFKILLHGLEKHLDNAKSYIDYMYYITQKVSDDLQEEMLIEDKNNEDFYLNLHHHIEQSFQTKLDEFIKKNETTIHILIIKPDFNGSIIKSVLRNILDRNKNGKFFKFFITVLEDNFAHFNKLNFLNKNKWGNALHLVDSLAQVEKNLDIVITDNIKNINIYQYVNETKLLLQHVEGKTQFIPDDILFKIKPVFLQSPISEPRSVAINETNYISLTKEKEYTNGKTLVYKINKKQQYNGLVLMLFYKIKSMEIKVLKCILPEDYHYLCKDTELELNISINSMTGDKQQTTELHYTSACYIYLINEQYTAIPNSQSEDILKDTHSGNGPMFDISFTEKQPIEFHERCLLWCERLYKTTI
ncbi:hypothetical protein QEN19_003663 [Hanseniaspora menglaensis]